jgi:hypothetical protein
MDNWMSGFRIDEVFHPWGTVFEAAFPGRVAKGYASAEWPCRSAYGFATVYAEPTAPRPDRPVTTVAYELADNGTAPRYFFAELVTRLGPPDDINRDDSPERANESSVVLHANWKRGKVKIGLSLYGAPRPSDFGNGLGKLYLSWAEPDAAAAPFLAEWTAANQAAVAAAASARIRIFSLQYALDEDDAEPLSPSELALSTPDLLLTPPAIAARLGPTTFALWSDAALARWHLSSARSTVLLGGAETATVQFLDIAPARGGGYVELSAGPWSVRDAHGSPSIKAAVAALESLPGLQIERHAGHDA